MLGFKNKENSGLIFNELNKIIKKRNKLIQLKLIFLNKIK